MTDPAAELAGFHLDILPQPDDFTCGPTCLHAIYRRFGDEIPLDELLRVTELACAGTAAVVTPVSRLAWALEPEMDPAAVDQDYEGQPGQRRVLYEKARELQSFVSEAHAAGAQLALTLIDMKTRKDLFVPMIILGVTLAANLAAGFITGIVVAALLKSDRLNV